MPGRVRDTQFLKHKCQSWDICIPVATFITYTI